MLTGSGMETFNYFISIGINKIIYICLVKQINISFSLRLFTRVLKRNIYFNFFLFKIKSTKKIILY